MSTRVNRKIQGVNPLRALIDNDNKKRAVTPTEAAHGIIYCEIVMKELLRYALWLEPEFVDKLQEAINEARVNNQLLLKKVQNRTFGRDYIAGGESGDETRLDIEAGDKAVADWNYQCRAHQRTGKPTGRPRIERPPEVKRPVGRPRKKSDSYSEIELSEETESFNNIK